MKKYIIGFGTKSSEPNEFQTRFFNTDKEVCACVDKVVLSGVEGSWAHMILLDGSYYSAQKRDGFLVIEHDFHSVTEDRRKNHTITNIIGVVHS